MAFGSLGPGQMPFGGLQAEGILTGTRRHRHVSGDGIYGTRKHRHTMTTILGTRKHRHVSRSDITGSRKHRHRSVPTAYMDAVNGKDPGDYDAIATAWYNGTSREIANQWFLEVDEEESGAAKWRLHVLDEDGTYNPENPSSIWYQWLERRAYAADQISFIRKLFVAVTWGGVVWQFVGVPDHWEYRGDAIDGKLYFVWSGTDLSKALFRPDQNMVTIRSTMSSVTRARAAAATVLSTYGVSYDLAGLDDFVVGVWHRQDAAPVSWLAGGPVSILGVPAAEWRMDGGQTFKPYLPVVLPKENAHWTYDFANDAVRQFNVSASDEGVTANQLTGVRAKENGDVQKEEKQTVWNQYSVPFNPPISGVAWTVLQQDRGKFSNFEGWRNGVCVVAADSAGPGEYPPNLTQGFWYKIDTFKYTWGAPSPEIQALGNDGAFGHMLITGHGPDNSELAGVSYDSIFEYTTPAPAAPAEVLHVIMEPNPLIVDSATLTTHTDRELARRRRDQIACGADGPLNPFLRPGDTVREKGGKANVDRAVYVKRTRKSFSADPSRRGTSYEAAVYP